ncbi:MULTISPECIES: hypothetical protein [unclassified Campylobacter]|nr:MULTISPECIES: hypothetical protein [unclassified Campylobacter]MDA3085897.1 hypothetical protein [Campylobacter sp. CS_ED1]MDA3090630.1 hypothetical protein [Campylobacter sp. CS_ED2]
MRIQTDEFSLVLRSPDEKSSAFVALICYQMSLRECKALEAIANV